MTLAGADLRHRLHESAELSGGEENTARILVSALEAARPDAIHTGLGGHGVAAVFEGDSEGPTLLVRADMDALPLSDDPRLAYASRRSNVAHLCGHDGHMAILVGVAHAFAAQRPERGRVVLLFQPAEETGAGADAVLQDPSFAPLRPDMAMAQHNLPGLPLGSVVLRKGTFASASRGMIAAYGGRSAHAAEPHLGLSPVPAVTRLAQNLSSIPQQATALHETAKITVVGLEAGGPAFGTSPSSGRVMATLRAHENEVMQRIAERAKATAVGLAHTHGLSCDITWVEDFPATVNHSGMVDRVEEAAKEENAVVVWPEHPFAWSEDFGHFTSLCPGVLFGLGSGEKQPSLHATGYDFPDELIEPGTRILLRAARLALANPVDGVG